MGPELDGIFAEILNTAGAELAGLRDPLEAEMLVSELLGIWSGQLLVDADPDVVFGEGLIEHAQRSGTLAAQAVLRGIAAVGTDRQRTKAATAASALAARGVVEPSWADELADIEVTSCWAYGDVYGDQTTRRDLDALSRPGNEVIQTAMGWENSHLHMFTAGQRRYGQRSGDWSDWDPELRDEHAARLADIAPKVGDKLRYEYDFGDGWEHDIAVEEITSAAGAIGVTCLAGRRACPPDDCGGPWGYAELCEAVADPGHERHDELLGWLGGHFNPAAFDRDAVNVRLTALRPARRR